jgi:hypothetical protein
MSDWSQTFEADYSGGFASFIIQSGTIDFENYSLTIGGDIFKDPGHSIKAVDWVLEEMTPTVVKAIKNTADLDTKVLQFTINFSGIRENDFSFVFTPFTTNAYTNSIGTEIANVAWNDGWTITYGSNDHESIRAVVPIPGALLLLGAGMARLVSYARRRRD